MVTGWSYLAASSGVPASCISWTSAFPLDVTRIEMCEVTPFEISGCGGSTVTGPSQFPARVFIVSKDFCASGDATWSAALCASCCAKATVVRDIRATNNMVQMDFMYFLLAFRPEALAKSRQSGDRLGC